MTTAKAKSAATKRKKNANREVTTLIALAAIALVIMALVFLLTRSQTQTATPVVADNSLLIREDSVTRGPADAPVTLVEFLDFECEACRAAYPVVEQILADYDGRVRYVVRYFSNHSNSVLAVAAAEAAGEQGKYWEMVQLLFATQPQWGEQSTPQTQAFVALAAQLGLDVDQFTAALQNPTYTDKAARDQQDTQTLGLRGTPTFFVNGQLVYGLDEDEMRRLIEQGLQG